MRRAFARKREGDTSGFEHAKDQDRDRAEERTAWSLNEARDEQDDRDHDAEHRREGGGGETGRTCRGQRKENDHCETEQ